MNSWVSEKTKGKINQLLPPGSIDQETLITIINTIYFRGRWNDWLTSTHLIIGGWREVFQKEATRDAPFYRLDGSKQTVKMMWIEKRYPYVRLPDIGAQALRIPFRHREWVISICLAVYLIAHMSHICVGSNCNFTVPWTLHIYTGFLLESDWDSNSMWYSL